ncbi:DUF881 domain-containing protein [Gudongella sp. DL1XJH-153]|uniref:DUF881 domain-containing protein n=1 Tax=Gudongella sp. DL1XJH-153 TaxID=3409804 RepID=UPI003BB6FAEF
MKIKGEIIALVMVSLILGLILSIQFKTINQSVGEGVMPTQRAQELANELRKAQTEMESQLRHIQEIEAKIEQYEKGGIEDDIYAENLYKDAMKYRMLAGYTDLKGKGIVLEINDPPVDIQFGEGFSIVDELDLILQVVSVLNAAEAEAISINDQRYTAFTEIVRAGNHIEINGVSTGSPIIIKAIGNPDTLESALSIKWGIVWQLRSYDYIVHLTQNNEVEIPRYRRVKDFIYASPVEESAN